jgi:hypothetical protein
MKSSSNFEHICRRTAFHPIFVKAVKFKSFQVSFLLKTPYPVTAKTPKQQGERFEDKPNPHESPRLLKRQSGSSLDGSPSSR